MKWQTYAYGSITHYAQAFQPVQLHPPFITPRPVNSQATQHPTTPTPQHLSAITRYRFSLIHFRSPLLTESLLFSLPTGTEMFHFPAFPPTTLYIQAEVTGHNSGIKVTPFGNPRIKTRLPTPLGLSQVTTSFIGSWCQGIHRSHLVACQTQHKIYKDARIHYKVLKKHTSRSQHYSIDPSKPNNVPHPEETPQPENPSKTTSQRSTQHHNTNTLQHTKTP